ncbi:hypothetical protein R3W88_031390 [Solanum pinnatisectum]|uniref:Uncharacterized protein n=1 Tax=Solanum pinnatisectum TaxID=50273 RepID=A0AAV9LLK7_9SOLN|nr:hypothetical protein R3W88_031390 [Solanum pinnatisectum]
MCTPMPNTFNKSSQYHPTTTTIFRWRTLRRKKRTVWLCGEKKPRRGLILVILYRRVKLKCMLKKVKHYYKSLVKEIMEGGSTLGSIQQRLILETSCAVPVLGYI